ncbi:MAG: cupin domain-containing protein [Rhizobiaceae bacterium]|nr:cupin domain-containing protein [Rhizobiaceae bacterium]
MYSADDIIEKLNLMPHPEGGYFRETFRDPKETNGRSVGTAIFFLLKAGEISRWHKVDATEIWHFYAGSPLKLGLAEENGSAETLILGNDLADGQLPQHVIPTGWWQQAQSLGEWTLVGCTVSPGFEFSGFEMAGEGWEPKK